MCYSWLGVSVLKHQHSCHLPLKRLVANARSWEPPPLPRSADKHRALIRLSPGWVHHSSPQMPAGALEHTGTGGGSGWPGAVGLGFSGGGSAAPVQQSWFCWDPAGAAEPQKKGRTVVWLSAGLGLVSCGFRAHWCQSSSVAGWNTSFCSCHLDFSCGQWRRRYLENNFSSPLCAPPRCDGQAAVRAAWKTHWGLALACWRCLYSHSVEATAAVVIQYIKVN